MQFQLAYPFDPPEDTLHPNKESELNKNEEPVSENSAIAKAMNIKEKGRYALKVR